MKSLNKRMATGFVLVVILLMTLVVPASAQSTKFNRLVVNQLLNVIGTTTLTGAVTTGGRVSVGSILGETPATGIVVTMNGTITPLGTYQPLSSAGTVNTSTITVGTAGDLVTFINTSATSIVLSDTATLNLSASTITLGQGDTLQLLSNGTAWNQTATSNN